VSLHMNHISGIDMILKGEEEQYENNPAKANFA
jgi:hypothetical protein